MLSRQFRREKRRYPIKGKQLAAPHHVPLQDRADFRQVVQILNNLLSKESPDAFNSSWIQRRETRCYRYIRKNVRTVFGDIDWDRVTAALERRFQRLWAPGRTKRPRLPYRDQSEVKLALKQHRARLYVFLTPLDFADHSTREVISITLVRLAQRGNLSAKHEIMKLIGYTIDDWIEQDPFLSRWRGYDAEIRDLLEGCIRRYRYTGSFLRYVYGTLVCAGRGLLPLHAYSLDEPVGDAPIRKINFVEDIRWTPQI
jgi:hypothetical protein